MESPVVDSIRRTVVQARRRALRQLILRNALVALALALIGPALLLLFGAENFPPLLSLLLLTPGVAWAVWRVRRFSPSDYRVAQTLDSRWGTADQISTAFYFSGDDKAGGAALAGQIALAGRAASGRQVAEALPYRWSREASTATAMLALALLLIGVRAVQGPGFSIQQPLAPLPGPQEETVAQTLVGEERESEAQPPELLPAAAEEDELAERNAGEETPIEIEADPLAANPEGEEPYLPPEVEGLSPEEEGDALSFDAQDPGAESPEAGEGEGQSGDEPDAETPDMSEESQDLLDRLADAFKDMLENMGMESPEAGESGSSAAESEPGESSEGESEAGEPAAEGAEAAGDQPGAEMEGGESAQGEAQQAEGGEGGEDSAEPGQEGGSTAASGTAEGDKQLAEQAAETQAALDALEEFYQQRAEEMRGEVMIETSKASRSPSETPLEAARQRTDRGGIVSRDEIPAEYRSFIEAYFKAPEAKGRKQ